MDSMAYLSRWRYGIVMFMIKTMVLVDAAAASRFFKMLF